MATPRRLARWIVVSTALTLLAGCDAPTGGDQGVATPDAQATAVRGEKMAEVQRIISGSLVPTPQVQPAAAVPTACPSALWWREAREHIGESRYVQGPVVHVRPGPGDSVWLEIGQGYPDPTGLPVLVAAAAASNLAGKMVCLDGRIATSDGSAMIDARGAARIVVLD